MNETLRIGELTFALRRSARRATIGITIERDGALTITAPFDCSLDMIERVATEKQHWVYTRLMEKQQLNPPVVVKEFVNGEGFPYLGRSYRLRLVDPEADDTPALRLHQGRFLLRRDVLGQARDNFIAWYTGHAQSWIVRRVELHADRIGVVPQTIDIRDLGYRWGSCAHSGRLHFHWRAITLPPRIIEYIVAHELVHLCEPHHDDAFWQRLERAMPDYAMRKQWLAEHGVQFGLGEEALAVGN